QRAPVSPFVVIGDPSVLAERARALGLDIEIETVSEASEAPSLFAEALPVLPVSVAGHVVAGRPDSAAAGAVQRSIERAVELVRAGTASAVVTNPISKATLIQAGFGFPGHTEFLARLARLDASDVVMMLAAPELKV